MNPELRTLAFVLSLLAAVSAFAQEPLKVTWTRIPAGSFEMGCVDSDDRCGGDEYPRHKVTLTRPFEMMATEVTVGMYRASGRQPDEQPAWSTGPDFPLVIVEFDEATEFCTSLGGRLPTEAEWEYAARGGRAGTVFPWGNQPPSDRASAAEGAAFEGDAARPVKTFAPNGFGLHDMAGNVWEWVKDFGGFYGPLAEDDPTGPDTGRTRVVRGGSYGDDAVNLRTSNRTPNPPDRANLNVGFRCVREIAAAQAGIIAVDQEPRHSIVHSTDLFRVLRVAVPAGDTTLEHRHDFDLLTINVENGQTRTKNTGEEWGAARIRRVGEATVAEYTGKPGAHIVQNIDTKAYRLTGVENVRTSGWTQLPAISAEGTKVLSESRSFRVYEVALTKATPSTVHTHAVPVIRIDLDGSWSVIPASTEHGAVIGTIGSDIRFVEVEVR